MKQPLQDMSSGLTGLVMSNGLPFSSNILTTRGQSTKTSTLPRGQMKGKASAIADDDDTAIWHATTTTNSIRWPHNGQMNKEIGASESVRGFREDAILQTKETALEFDSGNHEHYSD
ncbi:hypothetical protein LTR56_028265 [Elasticomyces elasticus]|nr:hypothetical protein LTR56_028265 [Elasticomyces elasticus]